MTRTEDIIRQAKEDLTVSIGHGSADALLWEHAWRVLGSVRLIAKLPAVMRKQPDELALLAVALYHDAGWALLVKENQVPREEMLTRPLSEADRERSALLMEEGLAEFLSSETLSKSSLAIRTLHDRDCDLIEGQVVAEADNLDEFGVLALWPTIRRGLGDGKGAQSTIDTWQRRTEYHFWTARLGDSFRFPAVREMARRRLVALEGVMEQLELEHNGKDLINLVQGTPAPRSTRRADA